MFKAIAKLIGGSSEKAVKKLQNIVDTINHFETEFQTLSDSEIREKTIEFRKRLSEGETLDEILPEAFAAVREASKRTLKQRHFDVQLIGGIILHQGKIAEMKTGEGKTLVATLPAYLNALSGNGVHVVTVNDYLARRDAQWMGSVYAFLGLSTGVLQHQSAFLYTSKSLSDTSDTEGLIEAQRREAYLADITYGTNNEFGFDYLRDNMVDSLEQRVQRNLVYSIVDEVDNILIDEARTPLIISGPAEESTKDYIKFSKVVPNLEQTRDYVIDEKHRTVSLTSEGMEKVEKILNVENLYDPMNVRLVHFVENALKARTIFERDREYVVKEGEVVIVDEFTGRLMPGRRFSDGIHQALEAKEGVRIQRESITYATITLQNYFRMYSKLAGMTGTAATEAEEFWKIYKLDVVEIPTNLPMVREDFPDRIYKDEHSKLNAVVKEISRLHTLGKPVLVGTTDISKSELLSKKLKQKGISHEVLNAKNHQREASIVAQAGKPGSVTVSTNMAGRGTDIVLGGNPEGLGISPEEWNTHHKDVIENGGLHIIGTERHEARRIDNQLRGRSGRQGDLGNSRFYVSLDDDLMRRFGGDKIQAIMNWAGLEEDAPLENKMVSRSIEGAQVKVEAFHFDTRKHLVEYDDVINTHRTVIYGERNKVLNGVDLKTNIQNMVEDELLSVLSRYIGDLPPEDWDIETLFSELLTICPIDKDLNDIANMDDSEIEEMVLNNAKELHDLLENSIGSEQIREAERQITLRVIDTNWVSHLTSMENLRQGIGLQAYGQRDPLVMYKKESMEQFESLKSRIQSDIVHTLYRLTPVTVDSKVRKSNNAIKKPEKNLIDQVSTNMEMSPVGIGSRKVGRNELCPCDSGKKYKRCHGS